MPTRKITMVKKLLANGQPCAKCAQAEELLVARGRRDRVERVIWIKEGEADSEGARLAVTHEVDTAPFFVIQAEGQPDRVETSTLRLVKQLIQESNPETLSALPTPVAPAFHPSAEELRELAAELGGKTPAEIVRFGLERFGRHCGIAFSGAEDVVLIDMAARTGLPFSVFCLDTGRLHEETYRFIDRVRAFYGLDIDIYTPEAPALQTFVRQKGLFSFLSDGHGECCGIRKIEPLRRALGALSAWMTGQRRDQSPATRGEVSVLELDGGFSGASGPAKKLPNMTVLSVAPLLAEVIIRAHEGRSVGELFDE